MIRPLGNSVIVERQAGPPPETAGGIVIPETHKAAMCAGVVKAVGPGLRDGGGAYAPIGIHVGDMVLFADYAGAEVDGCLIMRDTEIFAVLEMGNEKPENKEHADAENGRPDRQNDR